MGRLKTDTWEQMLEQMEQDLDRCIGCRSCKVNCPFEAVIILPPKEDA